MGKSQLKHTIVVNLEKYELPFPLLSDKSTQMLQDFGAWGENTKNHTEQILK